MEKHASIVFINGKVVTVDKNNSIAEALAVIDNKIAFVGKSSDVKQWIGPKTTVIDLKGRSLLPGFIDAHQHILLHGTNELGVNCSYPAVKSIEDIKKKIKEIADKTPPGKWIRGWGYDDSKLTEKRHPNKRDLDEVAPNYPVNILRACGHISTSNSKGLEIAGIDDDTPSPEGGEIVKEEGKVTGVLKDIAHLDIMMKYAGYSEEELLKALSIANGQYIKAGITSIHDAGTYGPKQMKVLQKGIMENKINLRIYASVFALSNNKVFVEDYLKIGLHSGFGNEKFKIGPMKLMVDGSSSGPTAATRKPYSSNPLDSGILYMTEKELNDTILKAHLANFQVTAHAVGDKAIEMVINAIERALIQKPKKDHRHRIEHCALVDPELIGRIKKLGIIPIPNPPFFYNYGDGYINNYGNERVRYMFPCKSFVEKGIVAAAGTDCPITKAEPIFGIYSAVNRLTQKGKIAGPEECVSIEDAIRLFTINGAYASFEENIKGSLEIGKLADLVVLSDDILACRPEDIKNLKVDMTMIDGEIVFER